MNHLQNLFEFDTVEQGEINLEEAIKLRNQMGGALYWNILDDDCHEIFSKLENLKIKQDNNMKTTQEKLLGLTTSVRIRKETSEIKFCNQINEIWIDDYINMYIEDRTYYFVITEVLITNFNMGTITAKEIPCFIGDRLSQDNTIEYNQIIGQKVYKITDLGIIDNLRDSLEPFTHDPKQWFD